MLNMLTGPAGQLLLSTSLLLYWLETQRTTDSHFGGALFNCLTAELAYIKTKMSLGSKTVEAITGKHR